VKPAITVSPKAGRGRGAQPASLAGARRRPVVAPPDGPAALSAAGVEPEPIEWFWPERIPYGAITLLVGDPGLGKSLLSLRLVAELSRGAGSLLGGPASSLLLSAEDSRVHTVVPRLRALDADLALVHFGVTIKDGIEESIYLPNDIELLTRLVEETDARLVVIDPLMAYLPGKVNSWMDQSVRLALAPLHRLAEASGAAILVVSHLNKGHGTDPLQRVGGSVGIPAAARSVLLLGRDPDDPEAEQGSSRVLAHVKSNLGRLTASLAFEIEEKTVFDGSQVPAIAHRGPSAYVGSQLLMQQEPRESKLARAVTLLGAELTDGPKPVLELRAMAAELGISVTTLERARKQLGAEPEKAGLQSGWQWKLLESSEADAGT
jgi:hypothetical protein